MSVRHPSLDIEHENPIGWIQWKGTEVCMDIYCVCGARSHIHGQFCYYVKCSVCGQTYEADGHIKLWAVPSELASPLCSEDNGEE